MSKGVQSMSGREPSFIKNTLILTAAGMFARGLGAVYRIFLSRVIQDEGMGLYQMAYNVYAVVITISLMGFPIAISKIVAEKTIQKDHRGAYRTFVISLWTLVVLGLFSSALLYLGSGFLVTHYLKEPRAYLSLIIISPAAFIVSVMAAFRGYFQGLQEMVPRAISEIAEQIVRVSTILALAVFLIGRGVEYASAGAAFGVVAGSAVGLVYLLMVYAWRRPKIQSLLAAQPPRASDESAGRLLGRLAYLAIPVTLGSLIWPVMQFLDVIIVLGQLQKAGFAPERATQLYGQLSGQAGPLINMPTIVTVALVASLVPAISEALAMKNHHVIRARASLAIKLSTLLALPATAGIYVLATPIAQFLYDNPEAGSVIAADSPVILFLLLYQASAGILQGLGKTVVPVLNLLAGTIPKVILTFTLTGIASINVRGAAWATVVGFGVAAVLNLIFVYRYTGMKVQWWGLITAPLLSVTGMVLAVIPGYRYIFTLTGSNGIATVGSIALGAAVYGLMLLLTGSLTREELVAIPGIGRPAVRALNRIGLMKEKK